MKKVHTTLEDDLTGGTATATIRFSYEGARYEIDLNDENAQKLRECLTPYMDAGRQIGGTRKKPARARRGTANAPKKPKKGTSSRRDVAAADEAAAVREWAREHNLDVPARGRIPKKIMEAYKAA